MSHRLAAVLSLLALVAGLLVATQGAASGAPRRGCQAHHVSTDSGIGKVRFASLNVQYRFCYDGNRVTRVEQPEVWGTVTTTGKVDGWSVEEASVNVQSAGPVGYEETSYTITGIGRFTSCLAKVGCVYDWNPQLRIRVADNGKTTCVAKGRGAQKCEYVQD